MSEGENKPPQPALEAPGTLRPDQNFLDQEPFRTVLAQVSQNHRLDLRELRINVIRARYDLQAAAEKPEEKEDILQKLVYGGVRQKTHLDPGGENFSIVPGLLTIKYPQRKEYHSALSELIQTLEPLALEYLACQYDTMYSDSGSPLRTTASIKSEPKEYFPSNYPMWLQKRRKLAQKEKNAVLLGLSEAIKGAVVPKETHKRLSHGVTFRTGKSTS